MLDNPENAEKAYTTAIGKQSGLFSPYLYRGLLRFEQTNYTGARSDLDRSHALLPTAVSAFYLGELAMQSGDSNAAMSYYQQASQGGNSELARRAHQRRAQLEWGSAPYNHLPSQPFVGSDGYLRVAVRNDTGIAVTAVRVQLMDMRNSNPAANRTTLRGSYNLEPGQQIEINTGLGPFQDTSQARAYRSQVIQAQPAE